MVFEKSVQITYVNHFGHLFMLAVLQHFRSYFVQGVVVLLAGYYAVQPATGGRCSGIHCAGLGLLIFAVLYILLMGLTLTLNTLVLLLQSRNRSLTSHGLEVKEDGLHEKTASSTTLHPWSKLKALRFFGIAVVLVEPWAGLMIPARAFDSPQARARFIATVNERARAARGQPPA